MKIRNFLSKIIISELYLFFILLIIVSKYSYTTAIALIMFVLLIKYDKDVLKFLEK